MPVIILKLNRSGKRRYLQVTSKPEVRTNRCTLLAEEYVKFCSTPTPRVWHDAERNFIHQVIFNELTKGIFKDETKHKIINIVEQMKSGGADGVIFGCTEINLLIKPNDCTVTVFDTTSIHSKAAVEFALSN